MAYTVRLREEQNNRDVTYTVTPNTNNGYDLDPAAPTDHQAVAENAVVQFENARRQRADEADRVAIEVVSVAVKDDDTPAPKARAAASKKAEV